MEIKTVADLIKEMGILTPTIILESLSKHGLNSYWDSVSFDDREAFKNYTWEQCVIAKEQQNEYAYYFWNRMFKRLVEQKTPIGEEHDEL